MRSSSRPVKSRERLSLLTSSLSESPEIATTSRLATIFFRRVVGVAISRFPDSGLRRFPPA